ncbi:MAG: lipase family protein [Lachnospiraceae bacterium]|nr:lipase family protein [Lachnospiraceae bacterium]
MRINSRRLKRILSKAAAFVLLAVILITCYPGPARSVSAETEDEYQVTKSILMKTLMGTSGQDGYYSSEFYTSLTYNDRWLTVDNKDEYNYGVAKFAVILSSTVYEGISCMIDSPYYIWEKTAVLDAFGFIDTQLFYIENENAADENDATTIVIGHKPVTVDGEKHDVCIVVIRGTTGAAEWASNYDVGNSSDEYTLKTGEHPEWTDYDNHKGFDVVANRTIELIEDYVAQYHASDSINDYMITGHSRGAGIANIIGAKFDAAGYNSCAYTFASPNTTTAPEKYEAKSVFNIINSNDFIPTLPLAEWGFARYGTDIAVDIANDELVKKIANDNLAMEYVGQDPSFLTDAFSGISSSRDELYTDRDYECIYDTAAEKDAAFQTTATAIEALDLGNFITIENRTAPNADGKYYFIETLSTGAFMTGLSRIMSDQADFMSMFTTIGHLTNVFPKDSDYSEALTKYMNALTSHMVESFYPHMTICYYSIVEGLHEKELQAAGTVAEETAVAENDANSTESNTSETADKKDTFIGSTAFYITITAVLAVCAVTVTAIILYRRKHAADK